VFIGLADASVKAISFEDVGLGNPFSFLCCLRHTKTFPVKETAAFIQKYIISCVNIPVERHRCNEHCQAGTPFAKTTHGLLIAGCDLGFLSNYINGILQQIDASFPTSRTSKTGRGKLNRRYVQLPL